MGFLATECHVISFTAVFPVVSRTCPVEHIEVFFYFLEQSGDADVI